MARTKKQREFVVSMNVTLEGVTCIVTAADEAEARAKANQHDYFDYNDSTASMVDWSVESVEENL